MGSDGSVGCGSASSPSATTCVGSERRSAGAVAPRAAPAAPSPAGTAGAIGNKAALCLRVSTALTLRGQTSERCVSTVGRRRGEVSADCISYYSVFDFFCFLFTTFSCGLKRYPEGSGGVQSAAAHPPVEPGVVKKEPISIPPVKDGLPAVKAEPSEPHLEGARRDSAAGPAEPTPSRAGAELSRAPIGSAGAEPPAAKPEEKLLPPPCAGKEGLNPEGSASKLCVPAVGSAALKGTVLAAEGPRAAGELPGGAAGRADPAPAGTAAPPTAGRTWGAAPKAVPADVASSAVPPRNPKADAAQKSRVNDSVKTEREQQRVPTAELKAEFEAGADGGVEAEVSGGTAAEESCPLPPVQSAAEVERKRERCGAEVGAAGENAAKNGKERTGSLIRAPQSKESRPATTKGAGAAAASDAPSSIKEPSSAAKVVLKAVVSVPDILKPRVAVQRSKPALCKGEERAAPSKARPQGAAAGQRKAALKEEAQPSSSGKAGGGRNASQQQKDSQGEPRAASKQWQDGESRWSGTKKDGSSTKVRRGGQEGLLTNRVLLSCVERGALGLRSPSPVLKALWSCTRADRQLL